MSNTRKILVGVFIVGGLLLFAVGLFLIGSSAQIFSSHYVLYTDFNSVDTITQGAKVRVSGMNAGQITEITVPKSPSSHFRLKLQVDQKFRPIIRQDSVASIETEGMVGNKFVDIKMGTARSPECAPGCTLPSQEPVELADLMRQGTGIAKSVQATIDDLHSKSDVAIGHVTSLLTHANGLVGHVDGVVGHVNGVVGHVDGTILASRADVKAITSNAAHLTQHANDLVTSVQQGQGAVGKLLADKSVASDITTTVGNAKDASANVKQASTKVTAMTDELHQAVSTFLQTNNKNENTVQKLRETIDSADRAAINLQDDTDALKHNFFLRGFFNRRGFYDLDNLTPEKYAKTQFVRKPRLRVWIPAPGLFKAQSNGKQELTEEGRSILDQDMAEVVRYLPDNPIMVEGYASDGNPDENFMASRERAIEVEDYLESRYHVDPKFIGAIPLENRPPDGAGRDTWNGVCLVVVASK